MLAEFELNSVERWTEWAGVVYACPNSIRGWADTVGALVYVRGAICPMLLDGVVLR